MTSLVTTLTLMMAFNAIVFDGVSAEEPEYVKPYIFENPDNSGVTEGTDAANATQEVTKCKAIGSNVTECLKQKWTQSSDIPQKSRHCCHLSETLCARKRVVGSDECKAEQPPKTLDDLEVSAKTSCVNVTDDSQKYCSALKTKQIGDKCKPYAKYMCFNASSHLMSRPLLVFTPIVTLFVIYFFN